MALHILSVDKHIKQGFKEVFGDDADNYSFSDFGYRAIAENPVTGSRVPVQIGLFQDSEQDLLNEGNSFKIIVKMSSPLVKVGDNDRGISSLGFALKKKFEGTSFLNHNNVFWAVTAYEGHIFLNEDFADYLDNFLQSCGAMQTLIKNKTDYEPYDPNS